MEIFTWNSFIFFFKLFFYNYKQLVFMLQFSVSTAEGAIERTQIFKRGFIILQTDETRDFVTPVP